MDGLGFFVTGSGAPDGDFITVVAAVGFRALKENATLRVSADGSGLNADALVGAVDFRLCALD